MFRCFSKIRHVLIRRWPKQTDLHLVTSILFRIKLRLPSPCLIKPMLRLAVSVLVYSLSRSSSLDQNVSLNLCLQVFSRLFHCVFGFEYRCVWIHHHPTITQSLPALPFSYLDLDCRTMLLCVCLYTVSHSSFAVRRCVQHTLWSDVNEFLHYSLEVCSTDIAVFHFKWQTCRHHDWYKYLTWLESTDSSLKDVCASRLCKTRRFLHARHRLNNLINSFRMYSINLFLFRSRTQSHLFLLHRSPLGAPQHGGLVMSRAFAPIQARDQHQIFRKIFIVVIPRILLALSQSSEVSGTEPMISPADFIRSSSVNCSRSAFSIASINFG